MRLDIYDILDIAVVSLLIYLGISWFKKTRAAFVLIGIFLLGSVYIIARYFGLFLTTSILQGFFAVLLVALVVIFQEELRHFFERLAVWGLRRRQQQQESSPIVEEIASAVASFVRERIGALFVIAGKDPVDRHIEGGHDLDGLPSAPLFESIFDPNSIGHDGAVIVENGRVKCFATRLPLSKNIQKIADYGTRHTAALGLSERCDAMCIVVSEERGKVSIARDGSLREIGEIERVGPVITRFLAEKFPTSQASLFKRIVKSSWREKIIAIGLGMALWFLFAHPTDMLVKDFETPIEYTNLSQDYIIDNVDPRKVAVTLSGDSRAFDLFERDEKNLKIVLDLSGAKTGKHRIGIDEKMLQLPRKMKLTNINPRFVQIEIAKKPFTQPLPEGENKKR